MNLSQKIKSDYMEAFKAKNKERKEVLGFAKATIQGVEKDTGKELLDEEVILQLKEIVKGINKTIEASKKQGIDYSDKEVELSILSEYLPAQMSEEDIVSEVDKLIESGANNIGMIMKAFAGKEVDRKLVQQIAKEKLNG
jgi:uncharacterized protein YqeY